MGCIGKQGIIVVLAPAMFTYVEGTGMVPTHGNGVTGGRWVGAHNSLLAVCSRIAGWGPGDALHCCSNNTQHCMSEMTMPVNVYTALPTFALFLVHLDTYCCDVNVTYILTGLCASRAPPLWFKQVTWAWRQQSVAIGGATRAPAPAEYN